MTHAQTGAAIPRACMPATAALLSLFASTALAQTPAAPSAPAPAEARVADVVVVAEKPAVTTSIDRTTYNVARDLQAATGSISDVLRNLPSVNIDVRGNVSLRGDPSVQILIDGQPSAAYSGANRAQALQMLPASTVESIEVMTNPSAEFRPDGTGGIINIVTKKVRKPGRTGSIQAGVGSLGRWNLNALGAFKEGPLNLTANLGVRRNPGGETEWAELTRTDPLTGEVTVTSRDVRESYVTDGLNASTALDYDVTATDRLSANLSYSANETEAEALLLQDRRDGGGQVVSRSAQTMDLASGSNTAQVTGAWRRTFAEPGRTLNVTGRHSVTKGDRSLRNAISYETAEPDRTEDRLSEWRSARQTLSANYALPLASEATLKVGYDFQRDESDTAIVGVLTDDAGTVSPIPNVTNRFDFTQLNHQIFATYQRPIGKFTVLGGLRLEKAAIDYRQVVGAISGEEEYFDYHPSLHLQYQLGETRKLTASYSHRVQRPSGDQLNPFLLVYSETYAEAGNPALRPQEAHLFNAAWEWREGGRSVNVSLFGNQTYNTISQVSRFITPIQVLRTPENSGKSSIVGAEVDFGGPLGEQLSYRLRTTMVHRELRASSEAGGGPISAVGVGFNGSIDYRPTPRDHIQISAIYDSRLVTSEGYRSSTSRLNFGYQLKIRSDLFAVLTLADIFETSSSVVVTRTPTLSGSSHERPYGRTLTIGLTRTFGGRAVREGQFDYGT